jgi:hypothetical protein
MWEFQSFFITLQSFPYDFLLVKSLPHWLAACKTGME